MSFELFLTLLIEGTRDTLYMVGIASLLAFAMGLPLGREIHTITQLRSALGALRSNSESGIRNSE